MTDQLDIERMADLPIEVRMNYLIDDVDERLFGRLGAGDVATIFDIGGVAARLYDENSLGRYSNFRNVLDLANSHRNRFLALEEDGFPVARVLSRVIYKDMGSERGGCAVFGVEKINAKDWSNLTSVNDQREAYKQIIEILRLAKETRWIPHDFKVGDNLVWDADN